MVGGDLPDVLGASSVPAASGYCGHPSWNNQTILCSRPYFALFALPRRVGFHVECCDVIEGISTLNSLRLLVSILSKLCCISYLIFSFNLLTDAPNHISTEKALVLPSITCALRKAYVVNFTTSYGVFCGVFY